MTKLLSFDLPDLRLILAVAEAGSLSKGAAALPLALSAASTRIRLIEDRFGLPLFHRRAGGLAPSEAGEAFIAHARRILRSAEDAQAEMDARAHGRRGALRLWANATATGTILPSLTGRFLAAQPYLDLIQLERPSAEVAAGVLRGEADIGVLDSEVRLDGLEYLPLGQYRLSLLAPADHPLAGLAACGFTDAAGHPMVGLPDTSGMQVFIEKMAAIAALHPRFRVRAPSFTAQAQLVAAGAGLAVMPDQAARQAAETHDLAVIALQDDWASRELVLCMRPWGELPAEARTLARMLAGLN